MDGIAFDEQTLGRLLAGRKMGSRLHFLKSVDSTNRAILTLAREGAPEGTVVLAESQTQGRGRLKRVWQSPAGRNIYASILLRPTIPPALAPQITLMAGVAVAETVLSYCPLGVRLKWPNDVQIHGRKVCGILTEMRMASSALDAVVVGIGLNVNMTRDEFDVAHSQSATSLREEMGGEFCRAEALLLLLDRMEQWYEIWRQEGFGAVRKRWLELTEMVGRRIRVLFRDEMEEGTVVGVDLDGALLLDGGDGVVRRVTAGDATIAKD